MTDTTTDRAALRQRIAEELRGVLPASSFQDVIANDAAAAVLAVLPPPVSRADVLREAAEDLATAFGDPMAKHIGALGAAHLRRRAREIEAGQADAELRRMAAEEQPEPEHACAHCGSSSHMWDDCEAYTALVAAEEQPATEARDEDPARIDRLRPEFTEHASIEAIDAQLRRARAQERRWHLRTEWLIGLRAGRVAQKERGEWPTR